MNIRQYIRNPALIFQYLGRHGWFHWMSDERYIKWMYKIHLGVYPDLQKPESYNEKLQWLKLHDRKPIYTTMVDKYEAKKYISDIIGEEHVVPTIGVWDNFDEIDFQQLPDQFVLKCTHDSGGLVICRDKYKLDMAKTRRKINRSLKRNYYWAGREWPYKNVKPRIIAEKYMKDGEEDALVDLKFFCFDGEPKMMYITRETDVESGIDFFDMDFNRLDIQTSDKRADVIPEKPKQFEKMRYIAQVLSRGVPHLRVDFYIIHEKVYVGELTFFHMSGYELINPPEWERRLGEWIELPQYEKEQITR